MITFLRYWLPLLLWMLVIFGASADAQSSAHTSRFLVPILRWFKPDISPEAIESARWVVRKGAHMTEYAVLAWLAWRALSSVQNPKSKVTDDASSTLDLGRWTLDPGHPKPRRSHLRPWSRRTALAALAISISYAATDEFHQSFVKDRTASPKDVAIDTAGALLGLMLVRWCYGRKKDTQAPG